LVSATVFMGLRFLIYRMVRGRVIPELAVPKFNKEYIKGKRVLIVGGTNGLGLAIGKVLLQYDAKISVVGRSNPGIEKFNFLKADLSTVKAQTELAESIPDPTGLDILLFTQGILSPPTRIDNKEGIELDLAVSHIGRKVILEKLLERGAKPDRIFIMGFCGTEVKIEDYNGENSYNVIPQHMNTVAANDAYIIGLKKRRPDLAIYGLNPGIVKTGIRSNFYSNSMLEYIAETFIGFFTPTPMQYANVIKNVIAAESIPKEALFFNCWGEAIHISNYLSDEKNVNFVWNENERLITRARNRSAL